MARVGTFDPGVKILYAHRGRSPALDAYHAAFD